MISGQSLTCPKGTSLTFEIDMDTGSDLTGATAQWALAESWFDQAKVYLTKTGTGDGLFIGQDAGVWKITVNLAPSDTLDVPSGLLYHDCKVLLQSGDVEDVANGPFSLDPSVNILDTNAPITRNLHVLQALGRPSQIATLTVGALARNLLTTQSLGVLSQSASATGPALATPLSFGTDLVAWYHADDATASSWPDRSSNGYNLVQATGGNQPTVSSTSFMGKSGVTLNGTSSFMKATGVALASDKFTVYAFAQYTPSANTNLRLLAYEGNAVGDDFTGPGSAVLIQAKGDTGQLNAYRSGGLSGFWFGLPPDEQIPTPSVFYRMGSEWDGTNNTFYAEGESASPVASAGSLASPGTLRIGSYMDGAAAFYQGLVREIIITKNTITSTQRQTLMDHLARDWTRVLLTEGDSITYSPPANSGFTYLFLPNASPSVMLQNRAVGGSRLFQLVARASTNVYNQIPANKWGKEYVFFVGEGVNDIAHYASLDTTAGPAQFAADIATYCAGVKAAGADKIAIATITSRTDSGSFPDHDAYRNPYNTIIRNPSWQAANGIDVVVDFAADSIMGVDQAPSVNPTYFQDEVHPNAAGHARLEVIFRAAINGLT